MSVHSEPHIRDHTNEESVVHVYVRRKTKAQSVCHLIFLRHRLLSKKIKRNLLKRRCHIVLTATSEQNGGSGAFMGLFYVLVDTLFSSKLLIYFRNYLRIQFLLKRVMYYNFYTTNRVSSIEYIKIIIIHVQSYLSLLVK